MISANHRRSGMILLTAGLLTAGLLFAALPQAFGAEMADEDASDTAMNQLRVSWVDYVAPPVQLLRENGRAVSLPTELDDGRAVVMNFIYTTCETTCPLSSATFAQFQARLGAKREHVHLVSISTDPEQDTPAELRAYARKFNAGPEWQFYTGTVQASITAQQAFGAYRGDKMSHTPLVLMRAAPGKPWLRIDGFVTPDQLLHHYRDLLTAR